MVRAFITSLEYRGRFGSAINGVRSPNRQGKWLCHS